MSEVTKEMNLESFEFKKVNNGVCAKQAIYVNGIPISSGCGEVKGNGIKNITLELNASYQPVAKLTYNKKYILKEVADALGVESED